MDKKLINVSKIGSDHTFNGVNKQDFGIAFRNVKISLDGCSSGKFSDIGVGLFAQALSKREDITADNFDKIVDEEMRRLVTGLHFNDQDLFENFCFTIIACIETDTDFVVFSCGDGYVFKITQDDKLEILDLDREYNNFPPYYVYNLIKPEHLSDYKDGVGFIVRHFPKEKSSNIGVGSDGYRFTENLDNAERIRFEEALIAGKPGRIGQIINRNAVLFKDDITIVL